MRIGLIDVDSHNFPNLVQMKLSAWHKSQGDTVERYEPMIGGYYDRVYMSKVFDFTPEYEYPVNSSEIIRGGTGYGMLTELPEEIEHIMPDYSLYGIKDTAYGFMTRGCPRGCDFCIVGKKEGLRSHTVAPLEEFWRDQKNIVLLDPNPLAAVDWRQNLDQLAKSKAWVEFNQGVDIRFMTEEKAVALKNVKTKIIHFAWDRYKDKDIILPKLKMFKDVYGGDRRNIVVYILTNFNSSLEQDLERVYQIRDMGYSPFVMIYDKQNLPKDHVIRKLQRYVNNRFIFNKCKSFDEYNRL